MFIYRKSPNLDTAFPPIRRQQWPRAPDTLKPVLNVSELPKMHLPLSLEVHYGVFHQLEWAIVVTVVTFVADGDARLPDSELLCPRCDRVPLQRRSHGP